MNLRIDLHAYLHILSGSAGRLVLQAAYFGLLVNSLSLADYGVFASALVAALIIANGGTFGFAAPVFRAATTRRRLLGWYLGGLYVYMLASLPLTLALAAAVHALILKDYLSLSAFLAITVSEAVCWRLIDAVHTVNVGVGRYATASFAALLGSALRTLAAVAFALFGGGTLEDWTVLYLAANVAAAVGCLLVFQPRIRPRWRWRIFGRRLPESLSYEMMNLIQLLQLEGDKLLILFLTNQTTAGLYAIAMRIIDFAAVPVRSFFPIYVQMLMRRRAALRDWVAGLKVEAAIGAVTLLLFVGFIAALSIRPTLLGANIAAAYGWFSGLILVAPAKLLVAYHREIFFAANRVFAFALISALLLVLKLVALALIATAMPEVGQWLLPLNGLFAALYVISALLTWRVISARPSPAAPAGEVLAPAA